MAQGLRHGEYLLKHLPKADVLDKIKQWRNQVKAAEDAAVFGVAAPLPYPLVAA